MFYCLCCYCVYLCGKFHETDKNYGKRKYYLEAYCRLQVKRWLWLWYYSNQDSEKRV